MNSGRERWDGYFLKLALESARMSRDPNTKVGSVIVGPDREIRSTGFNGFPRGIKDTAERLSDRDMKLRLMMHAERNAICAAARVGISLKGCVLYLAAVDEKLIPYGGSPCTHCVLEIIQAGIVEVVSWPFKEGFSHWREDIDFAKGLLHEAGLRYREVKG